MNDDEILADLRHGGRKGIEAFCKRYEPTIYGHVRSRGVLESAVADVVQEIFFKFFQSIYEGQFRQECSLLSWLYRVTQSELSVYWRKKITWGHWVSLSDCEDGEVEGSHGPYNELCEKHSKQIHDDLDRQLCIDRLLAKLECSNTHLSECLKILRLHAQDEPLKKIATLINRSHEATRKYVSECSKKLRQYPPLRDCW